MDLFEALYTTRAMRRVKPDPIPNDIVATIMDAAVRAPSGSNAQNWRFITVTDPAVKEPLGELYAEAWDVLQKQVYTGAKERAESTGDEQALRIISSSQWLVDNFAQVPLWILIFSRNDPSGSSIYPAVWNMMLAARGEGIGTCLTTILGFFKSHETFELLGVPTDKGWTLNAAVSAGYPTGRWGLAKRKPVHPLTFSEHWGQPVSWEGQPAWTEPQGYGRSDNDQA